MRTSACRVLAETSQSGPDITTVRAIHDRRAAGGSSNGLPSINVNYSARTKLLRFASVSRSGGARIGLGAP
jgi:hypothetical protein